MRLTRRSFLILLGVSGLATTTGHAGEPSLAVVAHPEIEVRQLNDVELEAIFLTERRHWSGTKPIIPFNLQPHCDERVWFDRVVLRLSPDGTARYWIDRRVRGGNPPPRQIPDAKTVVRLVAKLQGSIGYVPESLVTSEVRVVARIRNGRVLPP